MKQKKLILLILTTIFVVGFFMFNIHRVVFNSGEHEHSATVETEVKEHSTSEHSQGRGSGHGYGRGRYTTTDDYITLVLFALPLVGILVYAGKNRFIK